VCYLVCLASRPNVTHSHHSIDKLYCRSQVLIIICNCTEAQIVRATSGPLDGLGVYRDCKLERAHGIFASNAILFVLFATHSLRRHTGTRSISPTTYLGSENRITSPSPCWFRSHLLNQILNSLQAANTSHVGNEQTCLPDYYAKIAWAWSTHLGTTNVVPLRAPLSSMSDVGTTDCKSNDSPVIFTRSISKLFLSGTAPRFRAAVHIPLSPRAYIVRKLLHCLAQV
jgi:hypothetical protein